MIRLNVAKKGGDIRLTVCCVISLFIDTQMSGVVIVRSLRTSVTIKLISILFLPYLILTSLPKVIWEEGRVAALSHTYAVKSPLVTMARPKFALKSTHSRKPIPKLHYLPHHWTRPTYIAKRHPDPIRRFSTMHWTDRRTYGPKRRPTDRPRESLITIGRCATTATRPNNTKSNVKGQQK